MSDNPYPNASDTMHYELHTAWDEGYAEGFAAGRAAATPDPPDDWTAAILTLRRAMCTPAGREQVERELIRPFAASPDERLREAGERLAQAVARVCGEGHPALHDPGSAWLVCRTGVGSDQSRRPADRSGTAGVGERRGP